MAKNKEDKKSENSEKAKAEKTGEKVGKISRKRFEKELEKLQTELCHLQEWVVHEGLRIVIVFEGRDAAGKGGVIKRITERVSPRVFRVVALPAPSDREKTQLYMQRYLAHFPAPVRSSSLTAAGTIGPVSNVSWVFATIHSTNASSEYARHSSGRSSATASS